MLLGDIAVVLCGSGERRVAGQFGLQLLHDEEALCPERAAGQDRGRPPALMLPGRSSSGREATNRTVSVQTHATSYVGHTGRGTGDSGIGGGTTMHQGTGWLYVGDGWLRYREADGWTDHYLSAELVRGSDWPPPAPTARSQDVSPRGGDNLAGTAVPPSPVRSSRVRGLLGAGRHIGRHRARA